MITTFAPAGIGEITPSSEVSAEILRAVAADPLGPLQAGDIVVVTSKIISKAEGQVLPAAQRGAAYRQQTRRTVARYRSFAIVETHHGLVQPGAGIDNSNVSPELILTLPTDPDASARRLQGQLSAAALGPVGVIISDTAGRAWRVGQTDHVIGIAGVQPLLSYAGQSDAYGNDLRVTTMAVADELAAAADLVKGKLRSRPVAVIRGASELLTPRQVATAELLRDPDVDLFRLGAREAVIEAVALTLGFRADELEPLYRLPPAELVQQLTANLSEPQRSLVGALLDHAHRR